jgi:NAD(P)-dependent dehydrogenase (short-subunit alcohol dehydrogenase family)
MPGTESAALILGASRGLGLGLARIYLARGWAVVGTVRSDRTELHALAASAPGRLTVEMLEMTQPEQLAALRRRLEGRRFDVLFVNAGISNGAGERIDQTSTETFVNLMVTNTLSPLRAVEALADLLTGAGVIAVMSSALGSVAGNTTGGWEVYRASKAALNTLMRSYGARNPQRSVAVMTPGWVKTDMGGQGARLTVEESIPGVVDAVAACAGQPGVRFVDYQGNPVAW